MRVLFSAIFIFVQVSFAQLENEVCATAPMPPDQVLDIKNSIEEWLPTRSRDTTSIHILVAWHVITNDNGVGDYSNQNIYDCIENLNNDYLEHNIFFTLDTIDRTTNEGWFNNWYNIHSEGMLALNHDPYHYLNFYTADLLSNGVQGFSYLGNQFSSSHHQQSVSLDHTVLNSAWVVTHEVGHHLGLPHTFQGNCTEPNDGIDDTPQHNESGLWSCNSSQDTCPNDPGSDPVYNYMNYSGTCQNQYTSGQHDWQHYTHRHYRK